MFGANALVVVLAAGCSVVPCTSHRSYSAIAKLPESHVALSFWRFLVPGGGVRLGVSGRRYVLTILTDLNGERRRGIRLARLGERMDEYGGTEETERERASVFRPAGSRLLMTLVRASIRI